MNNTPRPEGAKKNSYMDDDWSDMLISKKEMIARMKQFTPYLGSIKK